MNFEVTNNKVELRKDVKLITPKEMVSELGKINSIFNIIYDQYYYYSKYEHYTSINKAMLDYDARFEFEKSLISITLIIEGSILIAQEFLSIDKQKIEHIHNLKNECMELLITFSNQFSENNNNEN